MGERTGSKGEPTTDKEMRARFRELEAKLAKLGSVDGVNWGVQAVLGAVGGVSTVVTSATGRCLKKSKEIEQEGVPLSTPNDDRADASFTPSRATGRNS